MWVSANVGEPFKIAEPLKLADGPSACFEGSRTAWISSLSSSTIYTIGLDVDADPYSYPPPANTLTTVTTPAFRKYSLCS